MQEGKGEGDPWVWLDMELLGLLLLSVSKSQQSNTGGQEAVNCSMDQLEAFRLDGKGSWQWGAKEY